MALKEAVTCVWGWFQKKEENTNINNYEEKVMRKEIKIIIELLSFSAD